MISDRIQTEPGIPWQFGIAICITFEPIRNGHTNYGDSALVISAVQQLFGLVPYRTMDAIRPVQNRIRPELCLGAALRHRVMVAAQTEIFKKTAQTFPLQIHGTTRQAGAVKRMRRSTGEARPDRNAPVVDPPSLQRAYIPLPLRGCQLGWKRCYDRRQNHRPAQARRDACCIRLIWRNVTWDTMLPELLTVVMRRGAGGGLPVAGAGNETPLN
jgi:hypothetical protein